MAADIALPARVAGTRVAWAQGLPLSLPPSLMAWLDAPPPAAEIPEARAAAAALRLAAAFTDTPPVSSRLPFSYQAIPGPMRRLMASAIGRMQRARQDRWARFPRWPLDLSADIAADLVGLETITFPRTPVLLTHDIDSPEGLANLHAMFLPAEEAFGYRSASYIVPCAWPADAAITADLRARGHEIGVHGYDHGNRTPFAEPAEQARRIAAGHAFAVAHGGTGYRAPSLLRTRSLLEGLEPLYRYDSSIPTSGGAFPVPNNGCASARPWKFGRMWELPLSMPRDGSLRFLGHSPREIAALWRDVALRIAASGGIVNLLTHCEAGFSGNPAMLGAYRDFLGFIAADDRFEVMLPVELVDRLDRIAPR